MMRLLRMGRNRTLDRLPGSLPISDVPLPPMIRSSLEWQEIRPTDAWSVSLVFCLTVPERQALKGVSDQFSQAVR